MPWHERSARRRVTLRTILEAITAIAAFGLIGVWLHSAHLRHKLEAELARPPYLLAKPGADTGSRRTESRSAAVSDRSSPSLMPP